MPSDTAPGTPPPRDPETGGSGSFADTAESVNADAETQALAGQPVPESYDALTLTDIPITLDVVLTDDGPVIQFTLEPSNVYDARTPEPPAAEGAPPVGD